MRLKILCVCQPLQPDSVNVPLCSRFEARPFPARSPQPVCRPFGLVLQQGLERSNTSLPVSDPLLLGLITKLAFPPGALLAGLTQWGQGRLPFSFICGRRCSSPILLLPSPVGVKVWENSNAAIANSCDGRPYACQNLFCTTCKKGSLPLPTRCATKQSPLLTPSWSFPVTLHSTSSGSLVWLVGRLSNCVQTNWAVVSRRNQDWILA